jgi:hypothetical protein
LVRIDQSLEVDAVAWIHRRLTGQATSPTSLLTKRAGAHGVIIRFFLLEDKFWRRLRLLGQDLFVLRKFRLPANTAIRGIIDISLAGRTAVLPSADGRSW